MNSCTSFFNTKVFMGSKTGDCEGRLGREWTNILNKMEVKDEHRNRLPDFSMMKLLPTQASHKHDGRIHCLQDSATPELRLFCDLAI